MIKEITTANGTKVKFLIKDTNEHQQRCWFHGRFYESEGTGLLSYLYKNKETYQGKTCLDIGASIGNHTVYFSKVLKCEVISIEPVPESYSHLKQNMALNNIDGIHYNMALGNHTGMVSMQNVSGAHFNVGMYQVRDGNQVPIDKLDNLFVKQFDFIKIDVEHYNEPLLNGGKEFFTSQNNCHVFIECETKEILGKTNKIMKSYGYKFQDVKVNHTPTYLWIKSQ